MILTDNKSIAKLIGLDIVAEIADDHVYSTAEEQAKHPVTVRLQEAWWEAVEDLLDAYQIDQFLERIDWEQIAEDAIDAAEVRLESETEDDNLDGYVYDRETGVWEEKKYY